MCVSSPACHTHAVQGSLSYYNEAFARKLSVDELLEGHEGCVNRVCWSQDGNFLASASDDRKVPSCNPIFLEGPCLYALKSHHVVVPEHPLCAAGLFVALPRR